MKDAELGRDVDFIPLATLTSDTAKSVKALLAAGSTLKLKESSMTQALQTKMRAFHVRRSPRPNHSSMRLLCACVMCGVQTCVLCACVYVSSRVCLCANVTSARIVW